MNYKYLNIAEIIKQRGFCENQGLLSGNAGLCIYYYELFRATKIPEYEQIADDLLDKVFDNIDTNIQIDFEKGLAGIGWGIEYLIQNGFAEGNADEILEIVDNKVFRYLNEENITSIELANGITGYLFYLISRLKNQTNNNSNNYEINKRLLIQIVNKIDEIATPQFPMIVKDMNFDLLWRFPILIIGLFQAYQLNLYNEKIRCTLKQWLPNFEVYLPSLNINKLYLAIVYTQLNKILRDKQIEKQVHILLFATDFDELLTEVDGHSLNIRTGWMGFTSILKLAEIIIPNNTPNHSLIEEACLKIQNKYEGKTIEAMNNTDIQKSVMLNFSSGIVGLGLFEIVWLNKMLKSV